jgi:hypothetical protein
MGSPPSTPRAPISSAKEMEGCPFEKRCEWVVSLGRLVEYDAVVGRAIAQCIAGLQLQLFAYLARNRGPALDP